MSEHLQKEPFVYGGLADGSRWGVVLKGRPLVLAARSAAEVSALGEQVRALSARFGIPLALVVGCDDPADCWHEETETTGASAAIGIPLIAATSDLGVEELSSTDDGISDDYIALSNGSLLSERLALTIPDALSAALSDVFPSAVGPEQPLLCIGGWTMATLKLADAEVSASAEDGVPQGIDMTLDGFIQLVVEEHI